MFLDTSGLLALVDEREGHHELANRLSTAARTRRTIHSYVLAEFIPLSQSRGLPRAMAVQFSRQLLTNRDVAVVWVDRDLHTLALRLLEERADKTYSLCDAVSFILMHQLGLSDALTTDRHFEQAGFRRLLP